MPYQGDSGWFDDYPRSEDDRRGIPRRASLKPEPTSHRSHSADRTFFDDEDIRRRISPRSVDGIGVGLGVISSMSIPPIGARQSRRHLAPPDVDNHRRKSRTRTGGSELRRALSDRVVERPRAHRYWTDDDERLLRMRERQARYGDPYDTAQAHNTDTKLRRLQSAPEHASASHRMSVLPIDELDIEVVSGRKKFRNTSKPYVNSGEQEIKVRKKPRASKMLDSLPCDEEVPRPRSKQYNLPPRVIVIDENQQDDRNPLDREPVLIRAGSRAISSLGVDEDKTKKLVSKGNKSSPEQSASKNEDRSQEDGRITPLPNSAPKVWNPNAQRDWRHMSVPEVLLEGHARDLDSPQGDTVPGLRDSGDFGKPFDSPLRRSWSPRPSSVAGSSVYSSPRSATPSRHSSVPLVAVLGEKAYIYSDLEEGDIRLVKLFPAKMAAVRCEIVHASLLNPPEYVAVSYTWGEAADTRNVQLSGIGVPITASLQGALAALREKQEHVYVWADQLCINQKDREERTQQVKMMTEIYSKAKGVAIWLGPEADESSGAVEFIRDVNASLDDAKKIKKLICSPANELRIAATVALFERDYWKRLWVVQEVLNAKNITIYCGSTKLPWEAYTNATEAFQRQRLVIEDRFPGGSLDDRRRYIDSQNQLSYSQVLIHQGPGSLSNLEMVLDLGEASLLQILRACRRKFAFDPRDKVFGILGILPGDIRHDFRVDYGLSVKEVYTDVVDYLLSTTDQLDVICEAIHFPLHTSPNKVPTWVPDWSHIPQVTALGLSYDFSAARDTRARYRFIDEQQRNKLEIEALPIDTIAFHGIAVGTFCATADYLMAFLHWRALLLGSDNIPGVREAMQNIEVQVAFCRTICLDQVPEPWTENWLDVVYHLFASLLHSRLSNLPLDRQLESYIAADLGIEAEHRRGLLHKHIGARMRGRCFCLTKNGRMGMGSGFMAPGDEVILPFGCRTPIIVRREGNKGEYRLVGDVYIHGYMDGRAVDQWKDGKRDAKKYILH